MPGDKNTLWIYRSTICTHIKTSLKMFKKKKSSKSCTTNRLTKHIFIEWLADVHNAEKKKTCAYLFGFKKKQKCIKLEAEDMKQKKTNSIHLILNTTNVKHNQSVIHGS